jgi:hypothetical protein
MTTRKRRRTTTAGGCARGVAVEEVTASAAT